MQAKTFIGLLLVVVLALIPDPIGAQAEGALIVTGGIENTDYINNDVKTAPSKRLKALIPRYAKVVSGVIVGRAVGLDRMMRECAHFSRWIEKIKAWGVS